MSIKTHKSKIYLCLTWWKYYLHRQHQQHRSVGGTGRYQRSSPSEAEAARERNMLINSPLLSSSWTWDFSSKSYQGEVIRVNPDNAEVRVVCVILSNFLQDLKELKTVWGEERLNHMNYHQRQSRFISYGWLENSNYIWQKVAFLWCTNLCNPMLLLMTYFWWVMRILCNLDIVCLNFLFWSQIKSLRIYLPGSDSSAKARMCSPSTSSSCDGNEDKHTTKLVRVFKNLEKVKRIPGLQPQFQNLWVFVSYWYKSIFVPETIAKKCVVIIIFYIISKMLGVTARVWGSFRSRLRLKLVHQEQSHSDASGNLGTTVTFTVLNLFWAIGQKHLNWP